jgi:hypothetical protein
MEVEPEIRIDLQQMQEIFLFAALSILPLGLIQSPIRWVKENFPLRKSGRDESSKLTAV